MKKTTYRFSAQSADYYFDAHFATLGKLVDKKETVLVVDEKVFFNHAAKLKGWNVIVLKSGEEHKNQDTVDSIIDNLVSMQADRKTVLVGIGGGVVTDITGYVAAIYMRGLRFGFVPTTVLAMVDAAIGGKNGIDLGVYKNLVGTIRQPSFLLYDFSFLQSLPEAEWMNGFAEIIKHACIRDAAMFKILEQDSLDNMRKGRAVLKQLIERNAVLKTKLVQRDEFERGERRLLNFGHTLGHALEKLYELSHGQAVAIGMSYASVLSQKINGFKEAARVIELIEQYGLPANIEFEKEKVFEVMRMDKKREKQEIHYVLLEKIGKGVVQPISIKQLEKFIGQL
ncbi:MAG TPA: 3-dehydroquinate synthase [Chitinophagaceae bacterium]|nr:3-dehydroquinate synthase [Chitinophagaceae bacterium]